jgi:hypothetical protein
MFIQSGKIESRPVQGNMEMVLMVSMQAQGRIPTLG